MIVKTEWGVRSPWGDNAQSSKEVAELVAKNMTSAGHVAVVVWRGVTPWMEEADPDQ